MSSEDSATSKQPAAATSSAGAGPGDLRHVLLEKSLSDKKKKSPLSAWDKLRENVNEFHSNNDHHGAFVGSPSSSSNSSPSSSRSSTPKPYQPNAIPPPKNKSLNPFMRSSTLDTYMHGSESRPNITLANTTLVAAQAAGMTNFTRNFRPARHHNGVIYATSTAVQQDIYRLERDLDKILMQLHARSQHASFAESASTLVSTTTAAAADGSSSTPATTFGKKSVFQRQSVADMFSGSSTPHSDTMTPIKEPFRQEVTRLSFVMTSILESIKKHKSATRLPLTGEILAVLAAPFDRIPLIAADCNQALDIFEYIRGRFTQLDSTEHFEQLMFCCRLLGHGDMKLKKRVLQVLNQQLLPCNENPSFLPSTPPAYHSLVYTLTNALAQLSIQTAHTHSDIRESDINESSIDILHSDDQQQVRSGILRIMDTLANGTLIPPMGPAWTQYHTKDSIPVSIAQLCVVEGLLKCVMVGICSQSDPYQGTHEASRADLIERARDILVLQDLLQRYWIEPELDAQPAYFKIIFLISELACETFLMASVEDLKLKTSTVSLLLPLVVDKLSPAKLQHYLANRHTDETQKMVTSNVIVMLLALLSICSLEEPPASSNISSPNLSPRPSVPDFGSDHINLSIIESQHDAQSINSFNVNNSNDAAMRKTLMTLKGYMEEFWKAGYKDFILTGTESMHQDATGERVARAYQNLVFHIDPAMGEEIAKKTLPSLFKRLVDTYPPALPALCNMLYALSKRFRSFFFKPVVSCVASDDEDKVSQLLTLMTVLRRYLSGVQFWMQDAEMINVLLLSDVGMSKKQQREAAAASSQSGTPQLKVNDTPQDAQWGSTTLGQCAIATEFMWAVKELRMKQRDPHRNMEEDEIAKKFLIDLERRLAVFLTAKEKATAVPMPLRVILCNIFIDIRFFCNTTHRPGWLTRVIDWAVQPVVSTPEHVYHHILPTINPDESPSPNNPHIESNMPLLHTGHLSDIAYMFQRLHSVYFNVVEQLQFETNDTHDYGGSLLKPGAVLQSAPTADDDTHSVKVPRHKRQQVIQSMYPISRSAAQSLDLDPPAASNDSSQDALLPAEGPALKLAKYKFENMEEINQHPFGSVFSLLAAVFTTLSSNEFGRLVRPLWERHMDDRKPQSFIPAVFLLMECGEKIPKTMIEVCTHDFYSGDPLRRLAVIQKHSSLSAFRFNVLSQEYIPISNRRRPFRGDGGAFSTPFVPTDLGSNQFTLDEPRWMAKLKNASNFPIELKRQIQELGWDDDDNGEEHEALKKVLTPLALLPSLFLEEEEERMNEDENAGLVAAKQNGKAIDISKIITRRKRATTIQSLTISFLSMVDLLNDDYGGASNALRELLEYFLRDDPALFLRAFLSDLGKFKLERHKDMLTRVRYLVSMQHKLPPGFTHILFNYLAGMLKWLMRENKKKKDGLVLMTLIHPILAELTLSTNDLSIRDLRKNKIEHLLVSTGRFWFTHEQPADLFPRYLSNSHTTPFTVLDIPPEIFSVAMLRISHIQFLTNYLARYPREVYAVKKTLQDYEPTPIPGTKKEPKWTTEETYYPDIDRRKRRATNSYIYKGDQETLYNGPTVADRGEDHDCTIRQPSQQKTDTEALSALRARIWLRFVDNLLNGLNKNYNDRDELERMLQGTNAIITEHDRDFGIIGQALILYTRVVTRFKRLFISNRGYTTFLPALFKVFCEVDCFPQVRSAIIFAWCRFYAVHEESFVFQMLGTLVPTILGAFGKSNELGSWMVDNLFVLMQAMHDPPHLGATSDVLGLQLQVELDDHERSIQERIDAASNPMAIPLSTAILKPLARSVTTPIAPLDISNYNNRSFELGNFVKLFLTIIAYDAGSLRAEQFVKLFRHMMSRFHRLPLLKDLVDEGMAALVDVFAKFSKHAKVALGTANPPAASSGMDSDTRVPGSGSRTESAQHAYGKQWQQNDKLTVRMEFVLLVHEYLKYDGVLSEVCHEKMAFIIRTVMRDYGNIKGITFRTDWLKDYLIDCLHSMADTRNYTKSFKKLLHQINSQYRSQWKTTDASDLYEGLALLLEQGQGKPVNMHDIAGTLNEKFVPFGLTVATRFNWENDAAGFNRFCNALVRLIIAVMENSTQDVLGEIEQLAPTPGLIAHIIIPICLQYNLQWDCDSSSSSMSGKFRPDPTANWTRLLNYISRACSQASLLKSKSSGFSLSHLTQSMGQTTNPDGIDAADFPDIKDGKQTPQSVALLFSLSFVAMKIILVRGSNSFNKLKGSWVQVAFFIKSALVFGQTLKFLKPKSGRSTPNMPTTPATGSLSPGGPLSPGIANWTNSSPDGKTAFSFTAPLSTGTIYDFTTWRFLEFAVCYRCPLHVFLKDFIHEKLLDMGGASGTNRSSVYAPPPLTPSPRVSINFGNSSSAYSPPTFAKDTNSARWKSWGGGSSVSQPQRGSTTHQPSSSIGIIPQLNVQDTDALSIQMPDASPTNGLGLHMPSNMSSAQHIPPVPGSPSLSVYLASEFSDVDGSVPSSSAAAAGGGNSSLHSPKQQQTKSRPSSSISVPGQMLFNSMNRDNATSTVLHVLHAESITSIVHVQIAMGFKPALPWMAANKREQLKPWSQRASVAKLASEWQLLLQLYAETDLSLAKTSSHNNNNNNNASNTNIANTPLI